MPNTKQIKLGNSKFLIIDLTKPLTEQTEVFPGDPKPKKEVFSDINKTGCQYHTYKIGDHNFHPHGDAPKHHNINLQDKGFEIFNLDYCFNSSYLIDLSNIKETEKINGIKYLVKIKKEHLKPYSNLISKKQSIVIRTGYDKYLEANHSHIPDKIPHLSRGAVDFILNFKNLKVIGTDALTIDPPGEHYAHQKLKDLLIVESMVHLYEIPKENFDLQTSPIKIVGATGGPITSYAFIKID